MENLNIEVRVLFFIDLPNFSHVIEPKYPGVFESIVDLTGCWNEKLLFGCGEEIIRLTKACSRCHEYCCRFLSAAGSLAGDTYRMALDCVDTQKLSGYCRRLAEKELKPAKNIRGTERIRFLSAVTNKGVVKFTDTAKQLCERIYLINDEYGAVSRLILNSMRAQALAAGFDVISCYCPLAPFDKLEQLMIPQLGIGFMTSNKYHDFSLEIDPYRIVNNQRFTDNASLKACKKRFSFNRKATAQMIGQAQSLLREAKSNHDELESYYTAAMNFDQVDEIARQVLGRVKAL